MTSVTVCVPIYNDDSFLHETLESVQGQTLPAAETIVVDDGSTAGRAAAVASTAQLYGARYVHVTHRGIPGARNTGLMLARGDAFLPLDADDKIDPRFIERATAHLYRGDIVVTGFQDNEGIHSPAGDADSSPFPYCALYRTSVLRSVGGWNGLQHPHFEDWDLWLDLQARGVRIAQLNEPLFYHRVRPGTVSSSRDPAVAERNYQEMLKRHDR